MKLITCALILSAILMSSCATIVTKSRYDVRICSEPTRADIVIRTLTGRLIYEGKTPATVKLDAGQGYFDEAKYKITVSKEGYEPYEYNIRARLDNWYFGNFLFGGFIGFVAVDPATGAMWKIEETHLDFVLAPLKPQPDETPIEWQVPL